MHGGDDGELADTIVENPNGPDEMKSKYLFDYTYEEIQSHHRRTKYFIDSPQDGKSLICEVW
jgi:hypothetical protein